jgi:4a-hydroxytetrahydrobiopterin dehydratase
MSQLAKKECIPCEDGDFPPFTLEQARDMMEQIPQWKLSEDASHITRVLGFKDFASALSFANKIGEVAEEEWHHPDLRISWGSVEVTLTTHAIRGLSENDFILAAKIDLLAP